MLRDTHARILHGRVDSDAYMLGGVSLYRDKLRGCQFSERGETYGR